MNSDQPHEIAASIRSEISFAAISHRQEHFAAAQILATCSALGCSSSSYTFDNDKVDFTVACRVKGKKFSSPKIDIQSKCQREASWPSKGRDFPYQIDRALYDRLRDPMVASPVILVVTIVPDDVVDWVFQTDTEMRLSHCSYWISLFGEPELPANQKTKTVRLSRDNIFCAKSLSDMMHNIADGQVVGEKRDPNV